MEGNLTAEIIEVNCVLLACFCREKRHKNNPLFLRGIKQALIGWGIVKDDFINRVWRKRLNEVRTSMQKVYSITC